MDDGFITEDQTNSSAHKLHIHVRQYIKFGRDGIYFARENGRKTDQTTFMGKKTLSIPH